MDSNGKFQTAINELTRKAAKALGRVYRLSTCNFISTKTLLDTFTSLVKPIMLFSSEIWGYQLKPDTNATENLFNKFCKHIFGVHRNTTNLAIQGVLETIKLILNYPFSKKEILSCKEKLKNSKSSGADMIKSKVLKICLDNKNFLDALYLLINEVFDKHKYPVQLKTELIKPIHKKRRNSL